MLAVKAEYENGAVRWLQRPPRAGAFVVTVVFEEPIDRPDNRPAEGQNNEVQPLPELAGFVPAGWKDAIYE